MTYTYNVAFLKSLKVHLDSIIGQQNINLLQFYLFKKNEQDHVAFGNKLRDGGVFELTSIELEFSKNSKSLSLSNLCQVGIKARKKSVEGVGLSVNSEAKIFANGILLFTYEELINKINLV